MFEIKAVTKIYRRAHKEIKALDNVSLAVNSGEFIVVQGPSGSGKSTLLFTAGTLLEPEAGEILIDGKNPYTFSPDERANLRSEKIGFVFQQFHLVPYLNVLENVLVPSLSAESRNAEERAKALIERFGLVGRADHILSELSTGERQRTALARAFMNNPKIILADEPTGNLDPENAKVVIQFLDEFVRAGGAVLLVTHDAYATQFSSRTFQLRDGRLE